MKAARVIIKNRKGHHPQGDSESADMILIGGAKGQGKELVRTEYWPWSSKSVEAAENHLFAQADRQGYDIVPSAFDSLAEWQKWLKANECPVEVECNHPKSDRYFSEDGLIEWCGNCGILIKDHHLRRFGKPKPYRM